MLEGVEAVHPLWSGITLDLKLGSVCGLETVRSIPRTSTHHPTVSTLLHPKVPTQLSLPWSSLRIPIIPSADSLRHPRRAHSRILSGSLSVQLSTHSSLSPPLHSLVTPPPPPHHRASSKFPPSSRSLSPASIPSLRRRLCALAILGRHPYQIRRCGKRRQRGGSGQVNSAFRRSDSTQQPVHTAIPVTWSYRPSGLPTLTPASPRHSILSPVASH